MNSKEMSEHDEASVAKFLITDPVEVDKKINQPIRALLQAYSHVPEAQTREHVLKLRDEAFKIFPYACIGSLRFLDLSMRRTPFYPDILARLKDTAHSPPATLLDVGCCFAQDLRQLCVDGVPSAQLGGLDIDEKFLQLGYDLFVDKETFKGRMVAADMEAAGKGDTEEDAKMDGLKGTVDIIWAASFFHLFPKNRQLPLVKKVIELTRPVPGSVVYGRQLGSVRPDEYDVMNDGRWQYRHDPHTWQQMWDEAGAATGTKWVVEASMDEEDFGYNVGSNKAWGDPDMRRLLFKIVRQ